MLFPKKSLLAFCPAGKIAHHIKPNFYGHKKIYKELGIKKQPKREIYDRHFLEISKNLGEISLSSNRVRRASFELKENEIPQSWSLIVGRLLSSGFMLLGVEYFYPIYEKIKIGKPDLPVLFESMGPVYFKGTRLVNNDGEIVVPYIEYLKDTHKWDAGFKKLSEIVQDTPNSPRTLSVYVKKEPRKFKEKEKVIELNS